MEDAVQLLEKRIAKIAEKLGSKEAVFKAVKAKVKASTRRLSGYQLFSRDKRTEGKAAGLSLTMTDLAEQWAALTDEEVGR
jgi:hypothetical protein